MKKTVFFFLAAFFAFSGCGVPKSPESIEQQISGGYKRSFDGENTAVIIMGAQNNLAAAGLENFKEFIEWKDGAGNVYPMDFGDASSPMYIQGRSGITYIAIKVLPGDYKLNNFFIRASNSRYYGEIDFGNRYEASFSIREEEAVFLGIVKTVIEEIPAEKTSRAGAVKIRAASYLENGREDLYKITDFYKAVTGNPVQPDIMYWHDRKLSKSEMLLLEEVPRNE